MCWGSGHSGEQLLTPSSRPGETRFLAGDRHHMSDHKGEVLKRNQHKVIECAPEDAAPEEVPRAVTAELELIW